MTANYVLDIVILLAAAVVAVPLFRVIGFGAVPGFLIAGAVVGPSGMALIDNVTEIGRLSELGVVLLLFVIGIELKPSRLWLLLCASIFPKEFFGQESQYDQRENTPGNIH